MAAIASIATPSRVTAHGRLVITFWAILALNEGVAHSPPPPPAIPPELRLTIRVQEIGVDEVLNVYRAFEQSATEAKLTCHPTMKDYESWREKGLEPPRRSMVCSDSHTVLIDASWLNIAPRSITIDFRFGSQTEPSARLRIEQLARELEQSLKPDPLVTSLTRDTWSPEHLSSRIK